MARNLYLTVSERGDDADPVPIFATADEDIIRQVGELVARRLGWRDPDLDDDD